MQDVDHCVQNSCHDETVQSLKIVNFECEFTVFSEIMRILVLPDGISSGGTLPLEVPRAQGLQP